ncbi:unnamed protein product [Calicophoron daubneyi]|uniref:RWD domain-containing protein n=1 Tax=Calicophoron daubneyi TaxID=300641 RepID=A0AAV2TG50_CALDB
MADHAEDRENELVALRSIYEGNFRMIKEDGLQTFEVKLDGHGGAACNVVVECVIGFGYMEEYPEQAPAFRVTKTKNLSDVEVVTIRDMIDSVIQRSLGYIMIFDILSEVQEYLNSICENRTLMQKKREEERKRALELEEEAKFHGDRVTVESFLQWNAKFLAEMAGMNDKKKVIEDVSGRRLTGRELFLRDNRYDDSDLKFLSENGEPVEIDESLFTDMGDLDLSEETNKANGDAVVTS